MMFGFRRRSRNRTLIERLHDGIILGSRQAGFYGRLGVPDTLEGRFEMAALHAFLLVRRLNRSAEPGPSVARDVTDMLFQRFDVALRETGTGDLTVPKKLKKMAQNYLGRVHAYTPGVEAGAVDMLALALARNVYGRDGLEQAPQALALGRYVLECAGALAQAGDGVLYEQGPVWPDVGKLV